MHTNVITGNRLMKCKHCNYAQDTAVLWGLSCPKATKHSFAVPYTSLLKVELKESNT